ncbi:MAG: hypothetical protein K0R73_207 [Candidatus Midichloriaceae bacterium]|jgi:hypothetical protein|nr:hypothetical protein [Candidatus Midichloriaceae bacterium]
MLMRAEQRSLSPDYLKYQDERVYSHQCVIEELEIFLKKKSIKDTLVLVEAENKKLEEQLAEAELAVEEAKIELSLEEAKIELDVEKAKMKLLSEEFDSIYAEYMAWAKKLAVEEANIELLRQELDFMYLEYMAWEEEIEQIKCDKAAQLKSIWDGLIKLEKEIDASFSLAGCEKVVASNFNMLESPASFIEIVEDSNPPLKGIGRVVPISMSTAKILTPSVNIFKDMPVINTEFTRACAISSSSLKAPDDKYTVSTVLTTLVEMLTVLLKNISCLVNPEINIISNSFLDKLNQSFSHMQSAMAA